MYAHEGGFPRGEVLQGRLKRQQAFAERVELMVDFVGADFFQFVGGAEAPADAVRVDACRAAHGNVVDGIADHEAFMWRAAQRAHSLFHHVRKLEPTYRSRKQRYWLI